MKIGFVLCRVKGLQEQAIALSDDLGVELVRRENVSIRNHYLSRGFSYYLEINSKLVSLNTLKIRQHGPVYCDFNTPTINYRRLKGGGRKQAIARAVGISRDFRPHIVDLTAGLAEDAFILASLGCHVTLLERNSVVHALLRDGIRRAGLCGQDKNEVSVVVSRMALFLSESIEYLRCPQYSPDIIYLDPMYPQRGNSAKVSKKMQAFQEIVGEDADADGLLLPALDKAKYRVVVKRPIRANHLNNIAPSHSIKGKSTRFDVYMLHKNTILATDP